MGRHIWVDADVIDNDAAFLALLVHELTHVRQWRERGPVGFLVRYWGDYLRGRLRGETHRAAYEAIPAEVEARATARGFRRTDLDPE